MDISDADTSIFAQRELPRNPDATTMRKFEVLVARFTNLLTAETRSAIEDKIMRGLLCEQGDRERLARA